MSVFALLKDSLYSEGHLTVSPPINHYSIEVGMHDVDACWNNP